MKLSLNIVAEPTSLDTRRIRTLSDINIANMIYEGLFRSSNQGPAKGLAESYTVDDTETIYRFKLRKAFWSNGKPITASDFVQSYKTSLEPLFPSDYAFLLYYIKNAENIKKGLLNSDTLGVHALDDSTLEFQLKHPIPFFLEILCLPIYFPISSDEKVCNGPFTLLQWDHNYQITLAKNFSYWDKSAVRLDTIELFMCGSETGIQMFERNQLDWEGDPFGYIPLDHFTSLYNSKKLHLIPACATEWIRVNTSVKDLSRKELRKAIAAAIHRQELTEHLFFGTSPPTVRICPGSKAPPAYRDGSIEIAKQLLKNIPPTRPYSLIYADTSTDHCIAQIIQTQLESVGIKINLERLEAKVFFSRVSKKDYELALGNWFADVPDAMNFLQNFRTKETGTNNTLWENETYKNLLDQSMLAKGEKRTQLLEQAESILLEECPVIPLFHDCIQYVQNPRLKGISVSPLGLLNIKHAYFEDEEIN